MAITNPTKYVTIRRLARFLQKLQEAGLDISTKADKVQNATNGNLAALDANGNLKDSNSKPSDFATSAQGEKADSAIQTVKVNSTALTPDENNAVNIDLVYTTAYCTTSAATAAKTALCSYYSLADKSYIMVNIKNANTKKAALTLNINSTGAKSIYINGTASSSSNYTLPAGSYLVYYDSDKYYFRTDGKITGSGMLLPSGTSAKLLRADGSASALQASEVPSIVSVSGKVLTIQ